MVATVFHSVYLPAQTEKQVEPLWLMGGYERFENSLIWDEFSHLAGGMGKRVAILAAASSDPQSFLNIEATIKPVRVKLTFEEAGATKQ